MFCHPHSLTNEQVLTRLDKVVYGHNHVKKAIITSLNRARLRWYQMYSLGMDSDELIDLQNMLLIGASGTGKTKLVQEARKIIDVPFLCYDATQLNPVGATGGLKVDAIRKDIKSNAAMFARMSDGQYTEEDLVALTVVFIDEIDKLSASFDGASGNWARHVQSILLTLLEAQPGMPQPTFIFAGAFTEALASVDAADKNTIGFSRQIKSETDKEDISWDEVCIKDGIIPELMGRISSVVKLDDLSKDDYLNILNDHIIAKAVSTMQQYGLYDVPELNTINCDKLVDKVIKNKQGVRGLKKEVNKIIAKYEFDYEKIYEQKYLLDMGDV